MKTGIELIAEERERQILQEGWTAASDDRHHRGGELVRAALCYAGHALGLECGMSRQPRVPQQWAWHESWWKPSDNPTRDLIKAGALIAAELDRLKRLEETPV